MLFSQSKTSVPSTSTNRLLGTFSSSRFAYAAEGIQVQPSSTQLFCRVSLVEYVPPSKFFSYPKRPRSCKALHMSINSEDRSPVSGLREPKIGANPSDAQTSARDLMLNSWSDYEESLGADHREIERRRRIGLANKGRVPWNKGRKHSTETCARIRQKTNEALRDPKVRKRISERSRPPHSNQTKSRIGASQTRLWGERLKWKRSREKYYVLWADNIAKAAKKGGFDQEELEWDSYEKLKREITLKLIQHAADKAEAKALRLMRAKRRARAKAERMERLAQKRKDQEERAKLSGEVKRKIHKRSQEEKEQLAIARELKLKERLTKIHKNKSVNGRIGCQDPRAWEILDLSSVKKGRNQKAISLADQIQAIKSKREESGSRETLSTSYVYPSSEKAPE